MNSDLEIRMFRSYPLSDVGNITIRPQIHLEFDLPGAIAVHPPRKVHSCTVGINELALISVWGNV